MYNTNKEEHCDKRLASGSYKLSKHRQPSLSRVAVVAFSIEKETKNRPLSPSCLLEPFPVSLVQLPYHKNFKNLYICKSKNFRYNISVNRKDKSVFLQGFMVKQ